MKKQTYFNPSLYQGRIEPYEDSLAQYYYQHITGYQNQPICLIGFSSDQGVNRNQGRIGAKHSPDIIKSAFGKLPISMKLQRKFDRLSHLIGDVGNVYCIDDDKIQTDILEIAQMNYANTISDIIKNNTLPIAIGGGHEIAFGSFMGLYAAINGTKNDSKKSIGIINLDAHFDLRNDSYATSGTPFRQIAEWLKEKNEPFYYLAIGISEFGNTASLFEKAERLGVATISEDDCYQLNFEEITKKITSFINQVDVVYLTLDLDCLQAGIMPAVSAVNAKGLSLEFVENCICHIINSDKIRLIDIAEFNPNYDIDGRGAKVSARLLAGMIQAFLLKYPIL